MGGRLEEGRPMRRYGLRDDQWDRIKDFLPGREGHVGGTADDNRLFVEAVLYRFRTGCPWRDLPERFGHWKAVHQRFSRWAKSGVYARISTALVREKKRPASHRQIARRIEHQNPRARRCLG